MSPLSSVIEREEDHAERRAPRVTAPYGYMTLREWLDWRYSLRKCFICDKLGRCAHREPKAEPYRGSRAERAA